jgi:hypothetical protein
MSIPPAQCSPTRLTVYDGQGTSELLDTTSNGNAPQAGEKYTSGPRPISSPLPVHSSAPPKASRRQFRHSDHIFFYLVRATPMDPKGELTRLTLC